jgi:hypothetical protein
MLFVIPAKWGDRTVPQTVLDRLHGIQCNKKTWIPAFAGMTGKEI